MVDIEFMFSWEHKELSKTEDSVLGYCYYSWFLIDCHTELEIPIDSEVGIFLDRIVKNALRQSKSEEEIVDKVVELLNTTVLHELIHSMLRWDEKGVNWAVKAMLAKEPP